MVSFNLPDELDLLVHEIPKGTQDDWKGLKRRLEFHLAVIESQIGSLEEYQSLDETPLPLRPEINKPLQAYIGFVPLLHS